MADREAWDAMALVGRIARAHGLRGDVIVNPETDFLDERFRSGAVLSIWRHGRIEDLTVETARVQQGRPVLRLAGVESIEEAEALAGAELRIPRDALAPLAPGQYYRHDLVGCSVTTVSGAVVGVVAHVDTDVGNDRLVVRGVRGEVLVPMAADICVRIDPAAGVIVIDPPEGLLDLNERAFTRGGT